MPFYLEQLLKAVEVESVKLLSVPLVNSPDFACIQQCREDDGSVDVQFGAKAHLFALPR